MLRPRWVIIGVKLTDGTFKNLYGLIIMDIKFKQLETGCIIPTSHKLNQDGYFRKHDGTRLVMYHRYVWEQKNGGILDGYEVDHICKNRACCNIDHLQVLSRSDHLKKDNSMRYKKRKIDALFYYQDHPETTGTKLAELFGVSFSIGCRWIREYKELNYGSS